MTQLSEVDEGFLPRLGYVITEARWEIVCDMLYVSEVVKKVERQIWFENGVKLNLPHKVDSVEYQEGKRVTILRCVRWYKKTSSFIDFKVGIFSAQIETFVVLLKRSVYELSCGKSSCMWPLLNLPARRRRDRLKAKLNSRYTEISWLMWSEHNFRWECLRCVERYCSLGRQSGSRIVAIRHRQCLRHRSRPERAPVRIEICLCIAILVGISNIDSGHGTIFKFSTSLIQNCCTWEVWSDHDGEVWTLEGDWEVTDRPVGAERSKFEWV